MEPIEEGTLEFITGETRLCTSYSSSLVFIAPRKIENCVWAFQFEDDEPIVFATSQDIGQNQLTFTIDNSSNGSIEFYGLDGKKFKIFAKENK